MAGARVFVVEDDNLLALALCNQLEELGYEVTGTAASAPEAVRAVLDLKPDAVLMDVRLADETSGLDAAMGIRDRSLVPIIFCTAYADSPGMAEQVRALHHARLIGKPVPEDRLRQYLDELLPS